MNTALALRVSFIVCFAALETTLLHLAASMLLVAFGGGPRLSWPALLLTALAAAWAVRRWEPVDEPESTLRVSTLLACAAMVLYGGKIHLGGGWSPFAGWNMLWPFAPGSPDALFLLAALVVSLWSWWRGMALPDGDHGDVVRTLQNGVLFLVLLALVITPLSTVNLGAPPWGALFAIEGASVIALGLMTLSLARVEAIDSAVTASRWRLARQGLLAAAGLVGIGILALTLVSSAATNAVRGIIFVIAVVTAFILSPLAELFYRFILFITSFSAAPITPPAASLAPQASEAPAVLDGIDIRIFEVLVNVLSVLLYALPLLILLLLIVMMQRRRREATDASGAQHESLWSWRSFGADLRNMLADLRARRPGAGLRDALARLRGGDPARRIRHRYVEALLLGEEAQQERSPDQTPLEFQPRLISVAPHAGAEVASLTDSYDRARYAPQTIQPADADTADAAWEAIRRSTKEKP